MNYLSCKKCGKPLNTSTSGYCLECFNASIEDHPQNFQFGWVCPKCQSVYAPNERECSRCNNPTHMMIIN